jgi:OOP family OmpA-OmpF porin
MTRGKILGTGALTLSVLAFICIPRHLPVAQTGLAAPSFSATLDNNHLTLSGSIGSQTHRSAIIARAQELLKGSRVKISDDVAISGEVATAGWEPALPSLLGILTTLQGKGSIDIHDQVITVKGTVASADQKAKVMRELAAAAGSSYRLDDHLAVLSHPDTAARPSRAAIQSSLDEILRRESIGFERNSAVMNARGRATLDKLVPILRRAPGLAVEVGGHTDSYGDPTYNLQLSHRRAESVRQYLLNQEVPNRLSAVGYGSTRPLSNERSRAAQQKNRRIELRVKEER